jgi:hypothetical protein
VKAAAAQRLDRNMANEIFVMTVRPQARSTQTLCELLIGLGLIKVKPD